MNFLLKVFISSLVISFVSWLSGKKTELAGFLTALPLTTLLALAFSHTEWQNQSQSVQYAKSIFVSIPITLLFFVPFLLSEKLNFSFWSAYLIGITLLPVGYICYRYVT